jgi:hypothetical protein
MLAERQHGVVAVWQLRELGFSGKLLSDRCRSRHLHRVHRGVYAVGHRLLTGRGRWMAACLAAGRPAVLSHTAASALHGLAECHDSEVTVTGPGGFIRGIHRRSSRLPEEDITFRERIPVTSVPRTLLDLAWQMDDFALERLLARAEHSGAVSRDTMAAVIERSRGRPGVPVLAAVHRRGDAYRGITRSPLEDLFLRFLDRKGLRRPQLNALIILEGQPLEVDGLWLPDRVVVELDSWRHHGDWYRQDADRVRDRLLVAHGYRPIRVTKRDIEEAPARLAGDLGAALTAAAT